jgi:hypothetical protein
MIFRSINLSNHCRFLEDTSGTSANNKGYMKQVTLKVNNISTGQWSTLLLELNLVAQNWKRFGPEIELQATSLKRILDHGQSNKPQAPSRKRHKLAMFI